MRRLLTALLTCGVVAAGLSAVAETVSAEAAPAGPTLGGGWALPPAPEGLVLRDQALAGDVTWAVFSRPGGSDHGLWTTGTDGSTSWQPFVDESTGAQAVVGRISSAAGAALIGRKFDAQMDDLVIHPGGQTLLPGGADLVLDPEGRFVMSHGHPTSSILTLTGERVGTSYLRDEALVGSRLWRPVENTTVMRARDLLDPDTAPLEVDTEERCMRGRPVVRGPWLAVRCADATLLVDLAKRLRPVILDDAALPLLGSGFLVRTPRSGGTVLVDPLTMSSTDLGSVALLGVDASERPRVLTRDADGTLRVRIVEGLAAAPPVDTTAPRVTLDPLPRVVDHDLATRQNGQPIPDVTARWSSPDSDVVRFRLWVGGQRKELPPLGPDSAPLKLPWGFDPCVSVQAVDRAGNASPKVERCTRWDYNPPNHRRGIPQWGVVQPGATTLPVTFRARAYDSSGISAREHRVRRAKPFGALGPWSAPRRSSSGYLSTSLRAGHRACVHIRSTDGFGKRSAWAQAGCVTAPYDDGALRREGRTSTLRYSNALGDRATRIFAGSRVTTPTRLKGSYIVFRVRTGRGLGDVMVWRDRRLLTIVSAGDKRPGWRWVELWSGRPLAGRIGLEAYAGPVIVDQVGVRQDSDDLGVPR
ncbi:hypothetical protein GCM10027425_05260 [Alteromonas gracilis]